MAESAPPAPPRQPAAGYKMVSIPFAQQAALDAVSSPLPPVAVPLQQALGRVLAEDLVAMSPLPPFAASIKDGYAVRSSELADALKSSTPASDDDDVLVFPVAFEALAGASSPPLPLNSVAYISTGAPLPEGADAVVQIEDTEAVESVGDERKLRSVFFRSLREGKTQPPKPGDDVRAPGSDLARGTVVLASGEKIGPAEIGLAATVGVGALTVRARPLVAVLSTGDELVAAGEEPGADSIVPPSRPLPPGAIRDANRPLLLAAASSEGCEALDLGIVADEERQTEGAVDRALGEGANVLIVSGGVSMGESGFGLRVGESFEMEEEQRGRRRRRRRRRRNERGERQVGGREENKNSLSIFFSLSSKTASNRRPRLCQARFRKTRHGALWSRQHETGEAPDFRDAQPRKWRAASSGLWVSFFSFNVFRPVSLSLALSLSTETSLTLFLALASLSNSFHRRNNKQRRLRQKKGSPATRPPPP